MVSEEQYFEDLEDLENISDENGQTELYEHRRVVADSGQNPVRVDKFLMDHLRDTSRNRIQKAAEAGYIMANGKSVKLCYTLWQAPSTSPGFRSVFPAPYRCG